MLLLTDHHHHSWHVPQKYLPWQGINYPENIWVDNYRGNDYLDFINNDCEMSIASIPYYVDVPYAVMDSKNNYLRKTELL